MRSREPKTSPGYPAHPTAATPTATTTTKGRVPSPPPGSAHQHTPHSWEFCLPLHLPPMLWAPAAGCRAGRAVPDLFLGTRCCPGAAATRSCRWVGSHPREPSCCWRSPGSTSGALRCSDAPLSPVNRIMLPPSACLRLRLIASSPVPPLPAAPRGTAGCSHAGQIRAGQSQTPSSAVVPLHPPGEGCP